MRKLLAVVALLACALPLRAQSLAEQAEKEKERRKSAKPAKVITEEDLRGGGRRGNVNLVAGGESTPASPSPAASPGAKGDKAEKTPDQERAEKREALQKRMTEQVDKVAQIRKAMDDAQRELNNTGNITFGGRRAGLQKLLDDGQAELAKCQQAMADIEEEARRAGVSVSR